MHKNFGKKTWLIPMPVLIIGTYDKEGKPNAMNAAWGGMWDANHVMISFGHHATTENIDLRGEFTISFATEEEEVSCDYVGLISAKKEPNKIEKAGWKAVKGDFVKAPIFDKLPLTLECKVSQKIDESASGYYLIGEIVNIRAEEGILGEDGLPDLSKLKPIMFDPIHNRYYALGKEIGTAFSDGNNLK
ncbi:MAG TPA: flavin oxidoreductase [Porphyromonadaceae bacterium]|nr:flavin oxidoreductase [Porphyromonadaceae bacterium]